MGDFLITLGGVVNRIGDVLRLFGSSWVNPALLATLVVILAGVIKRTNHLSVSRVRVLTIRGLSVAAGVALLQCVMIPGVYADTRAFALVVTTFILVLSVIVALWLALWITPYIPDPVSIFRQKLALIFFNLALLFEDGRYESATVLGRQRVVDSLKPIAQVFNNHPNALTFNNLTNLPNATEKQS